MNYQRITNIIKINGLHGDGQAKELKRSLTAQAKNNFYISQPDQSNLDMSEKDLKKYWKVNLRYLGILLSIWFLVSYVMGIILVDELNEIKLGGFKLGFWFAQQGSIYFFVLIILVYIGLMNKLDKKYGVKE